MSSSFKPAKLSTWEINNNRSSVITLLYMIL